jgi:soluble P-type ATPase
MPTYYILGRRELCLSALVLDLNGTVSIDGHIVAGVEERVAALETLGMEGYLLTADTRGHGQQTADALGLSLHRLAANDEERQSEGTQKRAFVEQLGAERVAAIGNGANDLQML